MSDNSHIIYIWTDGGCRPNPGPGGWGVLLRWRHHEKELMGGEGDTTNNRMELTAAAMALESLKKPSQVKLYTDSIYVRNGITQWLKNWRLKGWKTASRKPVLNKDLWQRLDKAAHIHDIEWLWVKGHSGNSENDRVDSLATQGREQWILENLK